MYWMMGGFGGVDWHQAWLMVALIPVLVWICCQSQPMNTDSVKVITVFIIAGVGAFDSVNFLLQLIFHCSIALFRCHKVAVLGRVGSP